MGKKIDNKILYLCIHKKLNDKVGKGNKYLIKEFFSFLGELYRVPKVLKPLVMEEMVNMKMIKRVNVRTLFIDPEKNVNKFYQDMGFY